MLANHLVSMRAQGVSRAGKAKECSLTSDKVDRRSDKVCNALQHSPDEGHYARDQRVDDIEEALDDREDRLDYALRSKSAQDQRGRVSFRRLGSEGAWGHVESVGETVSGVRPLNSPGRSGRFLRIGLPWCLSK